MTKKDYIKFAKMFARLYHKHGNNDIVDEMRLLLVAMLEADNNKFSVDKFNMFIKAEIMRIHADVKINEEQLEFDWRG